jgi:hypothetical protein
MLNSTQNKTVVTHARGCGVSRISGATYMVTNPEWFKKYPLSYFLFDPPILVENPNAWGLSAQGISYVNKNGVIHAQDWIGRGTGPEAHGYWNAADILEEAVNIGGSGLVPLSTQIGQLTPGKSRRLLFHPAGYVYNAQLMKEHLMISNLLPDCVKEKDSPEYKYHHAANDQMCSMLHWQYVEGGSQTLGRFVTRKVGDTVYQAVMAPADIKPAFALALIGWLPIDELHIVEGDDNKVANALKLLSTVSQLPFFTTNA